MPTPWQLFIDTGGTFTDAIAVSPQGQIDRVKVLSNSALRGRIDKILDNKSYKISPAWPQEVDILTGGSFRLLAPATPEIVVANFDPRSREIELSAELPLVPSAGSPFEVRFREAAPLLAARLLTGTPASEQLPPLDLRLGTTLATNALLTRAGGPMAQFITRGFADLLTIGTQQRPELFDLKVEKPPILPRKVVEVDARVAADGTELRDLDPHHLDSRIKALLADGITSAAVTLLHADRFPEHERRLASHLRRAGFTHISCSSDMARAVRLLPRAITTAVDAYLAPVVADYLQRIRSSLDRSRMLVMTSAGGLLAAGNVRPKDMLLSGPAGGVVGAVNAARQSTTTGSVTARGSTRVADRDETELPELAAPEPTRILSFDMGGTSTDVARYDDAFDYVFEHRVGAAQLFAPALAIETVAAGGGSICQYVDGYLAVGPNSAGAEPGPACYGAGGPLTLTDVNLLLGRLDPTRFGIPVSQARARHALQQVQDQLAPKTDASERDLNTADLSLLEGFLQIANERMADAMRRISIQRGYDPTDYTLVTFGGAGGQHACAVAELLNIRRVLVPPDAGLLSAWGMASAVIERFATRQLLAPLTVTAPFVPSLLAELSAEAREALTSEGVQAAETKIGRRIAEMRFSGQESSLQVDLTTSADLSAAALHAAFARRFQTVYGHQPEDRPVELVSLRVVACTLPADPGRAPTTDTPISRHDLATGDCTTPTADYRRAWFKGHWHDVPVYLRENLTTESCLAGPALIFDPHSACVIAPGWYASLTDSGAMVLTRSSPVPGAPSSNRLDDRAGRQLAAVQVELFSARLTAIAQEMGAALERTAVSTNVKERLDFSCAVLDDQGALVVNAPHIPVHLGSLGMCVRSVKDALDLQPGDMAVTNHPAFGGSHLPDLTVLAPVHLQQRLLGYVAARAHHAELGGVCPGSMPPAARRLSEEGVIIPPTLLVRGGKADLATVSEMLTGGHHPTRALADNLADLRAAMAACHRGVRSLTALAYEHGSKTLAHYMTTLQDRAAARMKDALVALGEGVYTAEQRLDDGTRLCVGITITAGKATVDFSGSAGVHPGNLNATPAIVHSVVIYVLRLLLEEDIPLNEGLLRPVHIVIPPGILAPPFGADPQDTAAAPSIVGGNVETSQRLVDLLLKAFGTCAASQGTMNNVLFGNEEFSYYETVGGGCGAGPSWAGASGVHSHMTNTRITDPELLELRYPVRLDRFTLRRNSGGRGHHNGGDGLVREFTFLAPLELSLLSQRRASGPYGSNGGEPGLPGAQSLIRGDGEVIALEGIASSTVAAGDRLLLQTPGGGGFGRADSIYNSSALDSGEPNARDIRGDVPPVLRSCYKDGSE